MSQRKKKPSKKTKSIASDVPGPRIIKGDPAKVNQVLKWILTGATEYEIEEAVADAWPGQLAKPLIIEAMQEASKSADADGRLVKAWVFEATRYVYQQAIAANDFGAALRALKMIGDLHR